MVAAGSEASDARLPKSQICSPTRRFHRKISGDFGGFCGHRRFALRCAGHRKRRLKAAPAFSKRSEKKRCTALSSAIRKSCNRCNKHTKPAVSPSASLPRCSISTRGRCRSPGPAIRRSAPPCRLTTFPPDTGVDPSVQRMPSPAFEPRHSSVVQPSMRLRAGDVSRTSAGGRASQVRAAEKQPLRRDRTNYIAVTGKAHSAVFRE